LSELAVAVGMGCGRMVLGDRQAVTLHLAQRTLPSLRPFESILPSCPLISLWRRRRILWKQGFINYTLLYEYHTFVSYHIIQTLDTWWYSADTPRDAPHTEP